MNENTLVSIILLSYNSKEDLEACLPSLMSQTYTHHEIIVVDNASTDNTSGFIRDNYPNITLIETGSNLGYPGGNNIGYQHARGEYIIILNPDTVTDPNWLAELIKPLSENSGIALTTSKILIYGQQDTINTCANIIHYTGLDFCRGLNESSSHFSKPEEVGAISGCSFAVKREVFEDLGGFDADFFLYLEDADLSWRARLAGYRIMFVPDSIVYHKFHISVTPWKEFYLERNRYLMLLKNGSLTMLVLTFPAFIVTEIVTWGHAVLHGYSFIYNKLRAYWWILTNIAKINKKRGVVLENRRIGDRELLRLFDWKIPFEQVIENGILCKLSNVLFNSFFRFYFKLLGGLLGLSSMYDINRFKTVDTIDQENL